MCVVTEKNDAYFSRQRTKHLVFIIPQYCDLLSFPPKNTIIFTEWCLGGIQMRKLPNILLTRFPHITIIRWRKLGCINVMCCGEGSLVQKRELHWTKHPISCGRRENENRIFNIGIYLIETRRKYLYRNISWKNLNEESTICFLTRFSNIKTVGSGKLYISM